MSQGSTAISVPPQDVLLVDDEEGIRAILRLVLEDAGHRVSTAPDGEQALAAYSKTWPTIVITDIKMPGLDGIALLKAIKELNADAEVIMMTGHGDMDLAVQSLRHGAADFITKPVGPEALDVAIARSFERLELKRQLRAHTEELERLVEEKTRQLLAAERLSAVGQTVAELAHAIRNIAGGLEGGMYVLELGLESRDHIVLRRGWEMIRTDVARVRDLALNLLDYARPVSLAPRDCDPAAPLREAGRLYADRAVAAGVILNVIADTGLRTTYVDPEAVHRCLANLLANAIEAFGDSPPQPEAPRRVNASVAHEKGMLTYTVEDNGPGMDEPTRQRLFTSFFSTKGGRGTGIGLMAVKKLMDQLGGTIAIDSTLGAGTRVKLSIPQTNRQSAR